MTEFVLKNNYFEFNSNVKHQISGTAICTKFDPPYACIHMDYMENPFLKNEQIQPWIWFRYIDDIFFIWTASEKKLDDFMKQLNNFHPNLKFINGEFITKIYCKPTDAISTFSLSHVTLVTQNLQLF